MKTLTEIYDWYSELAEVNDKRQSPDTLRQVRRLIERIGERTKPDRKLLDKVLNDRTARLKKVKPSTSNREVCNFRFMLSRALAYGKIPYNPLLPITLLKENNERIITITSEQVNRLIDNCDERIRNVVFCGSKMLMRKMELIDLPWNEVQFESKGLLLDGRRIKAEKSRFTPLHPEVSELIQKRQETRSNGQKMVFSESEMARSTFSYLFKQAAKESGLPDTHFHDLRHFAANNMRLNGTEVTQIMKWAGWKSMSMFNRYTFVSREEVNSIKW